MTASLAQWKLMKPTWAGKAPESAGAVLPIEQFVVGAAHRKGRIVARTAEDTQAGTLEGFIGEHVTLPGSSLKVATL
jgi:hypothetical protein